MHQDQISALASITPLYHLLDATKHLVAGGLGGHSHIGTTLLVDTQPMVGQIPGRLSLALSGGGFDDNQRRTAELVSK